jgi:hypothetical protein
MKDDDGEIKSKIEIPDMKYNQDINLKKQKLIFSLKI